jgi:serine/threonine protein kinase
LVCGLFNLHYEQVIHGQLRPGKLLLDDNFHLHISGFATTSLLAAKVVCSKTVCISNYACPEIFERNESPNSPFERRSKVDIYSLAFIIYELFGNAKWAEGLGPGEIQRRARENVRPALPGGINVRLRELISRCWDWDPDKRPTIEEVLREVSSMYFQFASDVDCQSVVKRALAIGPSDLITLSLPAAVPAFLTTPLRPLSDKMDCDPRDPNGSHGTRSIPPALGFGRVMRALIDYFESLVLKSCWNPTDKWHDLGLEERPGRIREVAEIDWNKIANFIIQYCHELLDASRVPESLRGVCTHCLAAIAETLSRSDQNLSSIVEAAARELYSAIPPRPSDESAGSAPAVAGEEAQTHENITADGEEPCVQNSAEDEHECDLATRAGIVREIGTGRFGPVNLIRMEIGGQWKVFAAKYYEYEDGCEELGDTFMNVLNAFGRVDHHCLARVLYYQKPVYGRGPIIATEYFETGSLDSILNRVRGGKEKVDFWTPSTRVIIICGIVRAFMSLHSQHLFHGYLKPTDILLDSEFNVHLTDYISFSLERFGLAFSSMVGSPIYAAPELSTLDDEPINLGNPDDAIRFTPIDAYCLGLIFYEILSGNKVFSPALSAAELRRKTMNNQDRPQIPSCIKGDFGRLIEECWNSDPSKRPPIGEIWHILEQMDFQITDGVDSDFVRERIASWLPGS